MGTVLLTELWTLFDFRSFPANALFIFQDPIQDTTLNLVQFLLLDSNGMEISCQIAIKVSTHLLFISDLITRGSVTDTVWPGTGP